MSAVLRVSECRIHMTMSGVDWWVTFRAAMPGRITTVECLPPGDVVDVVCDDVGHAEWLAREAGAHGVPRAALAVRRSS